MAKQAIGSVTLKNCSAAPAKVDVRDVSGFPKGVYASASAADPLIDGGDAPFTLTSYTAATKTAVVSVSAVAESGTDLRVVALGPVGQEISDVAFVVAPTPSA
jgi:hypothetical protein